VYDSKRVCLVCKRVTTTDELDRDLPDDEPVFGDEEERIVHDYQWHEEEK
jgi:hypothetical protein